jgi:uncharacterized protein (TIGR02246 family)
VTSPTSKDQDPLSNDERKVRSLYQDLLHCWNERKAHDLAALFERNGSLIGFDGTMLNRRTEIQSVLRKIFASHPTAAFVEKITDVRFITPDVAVLRAVAGMVPSGKSDINPAVNTIQTLVAAKIDGAWHISVFQNTPAAFHDKPELRQKLTDELRQTLHAQSSGKTTEKTRR